MPLRFVPDSWGSKFNSHLGAVSLTQTEAGAITLAPIDNVYGLILLTPQPQRIIALASSRKAEFASPVGAFEIIPANTDFSAQWNVAKTNIILGAPRGALRSLAETDFDRSLPDLHPPPPGSRDDELHRLGKLLQPALQSTDGMNELYLDSLMNIYWIHVVRKYSSISEIPEGRFSSGLSPHVLKRIKDYMHSNLSRRISLEELAAISNLSQSHFRRSFNHALGMPPHQYLLKLRIETAERLLVETDTPLAQIARNCGFASQSHITRVMKQWRGATPGLIRAMQNGRA